MYGGNGCAEGFHVLGLSVSSVGLLDTFTRIQGMIAVSVTRSPGLSASLLPSVSAELLSGHTRSKGGHVIVVLLYYDFALTFSQEIVHIWPHPLSRPALLFLLNRYPMMFGSVAFILLDVAGMRVTPKVRVASEIGPENVLSAIDDLGVCDLQYGTSSSSRVCARICFL